MMQLMPATGRGLGVKDPFNAEQSIEGGTRYLKNALRMFDGDVRLALAAYNAGPGAVKKYGGQVPPYRETRDYVAKITSTGPVKMSAPTTRVYTSTEVVDGRPVTRLSNAPTPKATTGVR